MSSGEEATVETLVLPLSGYRLQSRSDGCWRDVGGEQWAAEAAGELAATEEDWGSSRGAGGTLQMRMQCRPTDLAEPTWWLLFGDRPEDGVVRVTLADGSKPTVHVLGQVWGCEWVSLCQQATVSLGSRDEVTPPRSRLARREPFIGPAMGWFSANAPAT